MRLEDREDLTLDELKMVPSDNVTNFLTSIAVYKDNNWDVDQLFDGTDLCYEDFLDTSKWLNPIESEKVSRNFFIKSPVFLSHKYSYRHCIRLTNVSSMIKTIIKYTPYNILLNNIYKTVDKLENSFDYKINRLEYNKFSFKIIPKPFKRRFLIGHETHGAKGNLDSLFKLKKVKLVKNEALCYSSDLIGIINFFYKDHGFTISEGKIYLNGEVFAIKKYALLIPDLIPINDWNPLEVVFLVVKNYKYNGEDIFTKGEVYNAPFCYYTWEIKKASIITQKIFDFFGSFKNKGIKELDRQIEKNNLKAKSLMQISAKLEKDRKERALFLAKVVHEIKSPLSSIVMLIDSMGDSIECAPDNIKEGFSKLSRRSEKLTHFVENVMSFFNLDSNSFKLNLETIDIAFLMNDVLDSFTFLSKDLTIQSVIVPDRYIVSGDYYRLTQVFLNIIGNSVKFTKCGRIDISAGFEKNYVFISIKDTGIGIERDKLKTIFKRFCTMDYINKNNGIGLGLYISKVLIEYHNGYIQVDSMPGIGSEFIVYLPIERM